MCRSANLYRERRSPWILTSNKPLIKSTFDIVSIQRKEMKLSFVDKLLNGFVMHFYRLSDCNFSTSPNSFITLTKAFFTFVPSLFLEKCPDTLLLKQSMATDKYGVPLSGYLYYFLSARFISYCCCMFVAITRLR